MAIKGSLHEASLPDVLQLLALGMKTGCLSVTHKNNFGSIYFDKGKVSFASIVNRRDRLGDRLVKSGKLTQVQLDAAIASQSRDRETRLGDILVRQGMVSRDSLNEQIRVQIEEAVYLLFTWTEGTFNFEADLRPEAQDFLVALRTDALLMEGARRVDEWSLIEKKVPTFDIVFAADYSRITESGVELTDEQKLVMPLLDGTRDVQQIVEASGLAEFDVGKALYGLASASFLQRVGTSRTSGPAVADGRIEEHRNLALAFYKAGMLEEAMREFRRVTDLRPGDDTSRFFTGLSLMRLGRWSDAAAAFEAAATARTASGAVFHNLACAFERIGRYDEAQAALEEACRRGLNDDPRVRTSLGVVALRRGEVDAADTYLTEARALFAQKRPTDAWYHAASLASALRGDLDRAGTILSEGIAQHPRSSVLFNNQSVVFERLGHADKAFAAAEKGILENGSLPQLHKNLGDAHYRAGRHDDAMDSYQRAVKIQSDLGPDVHLKIGAIHFQRAERADAIRSWERVLELDPSNTTVRVHLDAARQQ